ncbi:MAG: exodeoxyribonuclease VII large subunit [Chloroflexi bacterium]|nr:exodeoxyribonuclease VII large subunit [Chloroflexota bacterium]
MAREPLLRFAPFQHSTHVFSVAELSAHIAAVLDDDPILHDVWLRGEVTNVSRSPAGHYYFALKDEQSQLRGVLFRGSAFNSPVMPANGLALVAHGEIHVYERNNTCELVADLLFPEGVGLAQMHSERVYRQLEAEGLFSPSRKRTLPRLPRRIGIVSSERGAVIHDLLSVLERRYPLAEVVFVPAPVQGPGAAAAMARAVGRLGGWRRDEAGIDVLVVARGGGSDDDLAAFNDERLARAIFASPVPVVSAVGHEKNLTLTDLVADLRAATPSAAAELLAPDVAALRRDIAALQRRAAQAIDQQFTQRRRAVDQLQRRLRALGPMATLARGYAIVEADGHVLHDAATVAPGDSVRIRLHRGQLTSTVETVEPESRDTSTRDSQL